MTFNFSSSSFLAIAPELTLIVGILFVLVSDLIVPREQRNLLVGFTLATLGVAAFYTGQLWGQSGYHFYSAIVVDNFRLSMNFILLAGAALTVLMSGPYLQREGIDYGEYYALILCATLGMTLMGAAMDLLMVFVALETLSIPVYILAAFQRRKVESNEAGMKYLLIGSFATGFLLYGIALVYGATGHTNLVHIHQFLLNHAADNKLLYAGIALMTVGFGFKVAAFPFHLWTPDVYEGAPTSVTAFMAAGVKVAAFAAFARVFMSAFGPVHIVWVGPISWLAVLTMTLGNFVALTQMNIKRLLAYSSIAHAGYLLTGLAAGTTEASSALVFYLAAYTLTTMGVFAILLYIGKRGEANLTLYDMQGLGYRYPLLGAAMVVMMMSLAGLPPTAGFMAKFILFRSVVDAGLTWLVVIAVLNSLVSVYYYLWVLVRMFMVAPEEDPGVHPPYVPIGVALGVATLGVVALGIFPSMWMEAATRSLMVALGGQ